MANDLKPGWYLITHASRAPECWFCRHDGRWAPHRYHAFPTDEPPLGWTLGPRIDDLLRDAARFDWLLRDKRLGNDTYVVRKWIDAEVALEKGP